MQNMSHVGTSWAQFCSKHQIRFPLNRASHYSKCGNQNADFQKKILSCSLDQKLPDVVQEMFIVGTIAMLATGQGARCCIPQDIGHHIVLLSQLWVTGHDVSNQQQLLHHITPIYDRYDK